VRNDRAVVTIRAARRLPVAHHQPDQVVPSKSGTSVGVGDAGWSVAPVPEGTDTIDHANKARRRRIARSPAVNKTVSPTYRFCPGPASATGGRFGFARPPYRQHCSPLRRSPRAPRRIRRSAVNRGMPLVTSSSVAPLPVGS
jgi:hypothetical protein